MIASLNAALSHSVEENTQQRALVVGAGIAGLSVAKVLKDKGLLVDIIEKCSGSISEGAGIALPANSRWALQQLGYGDAIQLISPEITVMHFTKSDGTLIKTESLTDIHHEQCSFGSIHRKDLHWILLGSINEEKIHYDTTVQSFTEQGNVVTVTFHDNTCKIMT